MFAGLGAARIRRLFARRARHAARDHLHRRARRRRRAPRHRTTTPSASRRSTSCSSRWTASPSPRPASSSWPRRTCSRSSTRRCCARAASTARSSSRRPTSSGRERILARPHAQQAAARGRRPRPRRPADERPDRRRPGEHLQRGGDLLRAPQGPRARRARTSTTRSSASSPACSPRRTLNDHERRVVAYHEAGHALCRELLPTASTACTRSRSSRAAARWATSMNLPDEDSYLKTREELIDQMTVLLGGRVAEQIVFGAVTTGAANDLQRVAEITHAMVHDYAMGSGDAPQARARRTQALSDLTRRIRDEEQRELAFEAHRARVGPHHRATASSSTRSPPSCSSTRSLERARDRPHHGRRAARRPPQAASPRPARRGVGRSRADQPPTRLRRRMFARIDHIGVAVEDLDAAIALYEQRLRHGARRTARSSTSRASRPCCSTSARTTSSCCAPLRPGHAGRASSWPSAGPGCTTSPTRWPTSRPRSTRCASAGLRLIDETPRTGIRGSRVAFLHPAVVGRRADRDRPARGGTLTPWPSASASASRPARRSPCG